MAETNIYCVEENVGGYKSNFSFHSTFERAQKKLYDEVASRNRRAKNRGEYYQSNDEAGLNEIFYNYDNTLSIIEYPMDEEENEDG